MLASHSPTSRSASNAARPLRSAAAQGETAADAAVTIAETDTRARIVAAAAMLLQRQGYEATSIKSILTEARATYGSLYHFFPEGKEQLAAAALRHGATDFAALLQRGLDSDDRVEEAIANCATLLADSLRASEWTDGCPVAATALELVGRSELIQEVADASLREWRTLIAERLERAGVAQQQAAALACTVLSTLEGAELLSRVASDDEPLQFAADHLRVLTAMVVQGRSKV